MIPLVPQPARPAEAAALPMVPGSPGWLRLARLARALSWLTLGWLGVEAGVAIAAAVIAGSVALLRFGLDSGIEALVHRNPAGQRHRRAARPAAGGGQLLPPRPLHRDRGDPCPGGR